MPAKTIAIDAMIEKGPKVLEKAIKHSLKKHKDLELILVGNDSINNLKQERVFIKHAPEIITGEDSLKQILQKLENSSTYLTSKLVGKGEAAVGLSFGNTKAVGLAVLENLKPLNGLKKIPLAVAIPSKKGEKYVPTIFLDIGSTGLDDITPINLLEFGILAKYYMKQTMEQTDQAKPKIGLLSNGEEKTKGTNLTRKSDALFDDYVQKTNSFDYGGFVEGRDVFVGEENKPNIIITDGYTGNINLKMSEGLTLLFKEILQDSFRVTLTTKLASWFAKITGVFRTIRNKMHPDQYGGAVFLGLEKPFVKGHGASKEFAITNAINLAYNLSHSYSNQNSIRETIKELKQVREYFR